MTERRTPTTAYVPDKKTLGRERRLFLMFAGIAIIGFALFYLYPIIRTFVLSLTDTEGIGTGTGAYIGFDNYVRALTKDDLFITSIRLSLVFAFVSGVFVIATSLLLAVLLNRKVKGIGVFRVIYFIPFIIPSFAVGAVYKNLFDPATGLINRMIVSVAEGYNAVVGMLPGFMADVFKTVEITTLPGWYKATSTALLTMIIISAFGFGVKMLIFLAALQNVPRDYYEVAEMEGATRFQSFWHITVPVISPVIFFNVVLTTIDGLKAFNLAFVMGNGQGFPANSTLLFPIYMFNNAFNYPYRFGYAASMAWIFFVIILALTLLNFVLSKIYVKEG
jgi:multiple sugar transport system permease protein